MNKKTFVFGVLCGMSLFTVAQQQAVSTEVETLEEVVITDSKFYLNRENSGKVITKITSEELEKQQGKSVAEIINATAGIEINGANSQAGQNLNYYVRGGKNRQVLILIDGIAVSDPSQIANDYDLRLLNANQVESIEILKGASSTLYGSGAGTAVINIKLKEASKKAISANFKSTIGTNQSQEDTNYNLNNFQNNVSVNGTLNKLSYLASFGNQYTDGLSSLANGTETDVYNAINGNLKLGYRFSEAFKMTVYGSWDKFKADFDDGFASMDSNDLSTTKQQRYGFSPEYTYKKGSLSLNAAYNKVERDIESSYPALYNAESFTADLFNRYTFSKTLYTVLGVQVKQDHMESFTIPFGGTDFEQGIDPEIAKYTNVDPYANVVYVSAFGLQVNAGARLNNHSEYGNHVVYSLNPSYKKDFNFGYLKGLASYGTAYITPSLYQLFDPLYGNKDLQPEENATFEVGAEIHFNDKATVSVVYFNRKEENFIDFVDLGSWVYQYQNVNENFTASGIEFVADYNITKALKLSANATYTKVDEDLSLRIPELKVNGLLGYQLCESTFMSVSYQFTDSRTDSFYNNISYMNEEVNLKSYNLLDFYVSHNILNNKMTLFANVTNILNEDYQELYGYSTKGRNVNIGFSLTL
ncbi:MAG: TonB-dependent receptor [Xanthomarina sp.]|uniref:TonB-dependent receptor plug domain-containing protein n=1 Tax=Xanthomarina sp. TaxID=1931211 RepID=UPI000C559B26|nr:TonB-dependent receptor plug domain-containing protein [Xanthomarina sp.]MAL22688.1 TonB-dependent receptor [Xanthomarina sp.]MBF61802.1 TonB-dependent receptor [Xanthomarina sp.]